MPEIRTLKKYPNRRLYDTALSKYVTLDDVRQLVMEGVEFRVVDAKSEEDLTRSVLLQIIMEREEGGKPIFTADILTQIIRFYGNAVSGVFSEFLQRSLSLFVERQKLLQRQVQDALAANPLMSMAELTERNLALWRQMQQSFFDGFSAGGDPPPRGGRSKNSGSA